MFPFTLWLLLALPQMEPRLDNHGDPLPAGAVARLGTLRYRRPVLGHLLGFTSTGQTMVFAGRRELVFLDVATGKSTTPTFAKLLNAAVTDAYLTYDCCLSGDGSTLLLTTSSHCLLIMDVATGKILHEMAMGDYVPLPTGHNILKASFRLAHDGKTLEMLDHSQQGFYRLRWIDLATGEVRRETPWQKGTCHRSLWFQSPAFGHIAILVERAPNTDVAVEVWECASAKRVLRKPLPKDCEVIGLGRDGKTAILRRSGAQPDCVAVDLETDNQHGRFGASRPMFASSFSRDGKQLFISTAESLEQWDLSTAKRLRSFQHPAQPKDYWTRVFVSPDNRHVAMEVGHTVTIYEVTEGKPLHHDNGHGGALGALAWSPSGKELLSVADDGRALWWDADRAKMVRAFTSRVVNRSRQNPSPDRGAVAMLAGVFPDGKQVAASWYGHPLIAWDTAAGKEIAQAALEKSYHGAAISPSKGLVAFGDATGNVALRDVSLGTRRSLMMTKPADFAGECTFRLLTFSPDGRYLAAAGLADRQNRTPLYDHVVVWELATGRQLTHLQMVISDTYGGIAGLRGPTVTALQFTSDGRRIAIALPNTISIFDLATGREEQSFTGQRIVGHTVALSPDGKWLAAGTLDGEIRVWDMKTGKLLGDVPGHSETITALAFSADGSRLASGSEDTTVLIWQVAELVRLAATAPQPAELAILWEQIGEVEPSKARKAMAAMLRHTGTVKFLDERLPVVAAVDAKTIASLIGDLDAANFARRDKARLELEKLAGIARPALEAQLKANLTLEARQRIVALLERLEAPVEDAATLRTLRGVEVLEWLATPAARSVLERLAGGAAGHRLTEYAKAALSRMPPEDGSSNTRN
jgi:WD40 repeat protein